jgi:hypothetical protein
MQRVERGRQSAATNKTKEIPRDHLQSNILFVGSGAWLLVSWTYVGWLAMQEVAVLFRISLHVQAASPRPHLTESTRSMCCH